MPRSEPEPVVDVHHGVAVEDPYRWLEDGASPRTREWIAEQQDYFEAYMSRIPQREVIRRRAEAMLRTEQVYAPQCWGNRLFYSKRLAHQDQPSIYMREGDGPEELLLDPRERARTRDSH
jgi:prolyl oligopeptidase